MKQILLLATMLVLFSGTCVAAAAPAQLDDQGTAESAAEAPGASPDDSSEADMYPPAGESAKPLRIPLVKNLRFVIRPTLLGLVPPGDPEDYGEAFVRVSAISGDAGMTVHYEIKEEVDMDAETGEMFGAGDEKPEVKLKKATRIRRGDIRVGRDENAQSIISPLFWGDGDFETDTGLIWLSAACFDGLAVLNRASWSVIPAGNLPDEKLAELEQFVGGIINGEAEDGERQLYLEVVDAEARYPCNVNGRRANLPAIRASDSAGFADYWILNDADNPLVMKMTYRPMNGTDSGMPDSTTVIAEGGGFAITEIDF